MLIANIGATASLAVSLAIEAKRRRRQHRGRRYCGWKRPLHPCEMTRQQKRAQDRRARKERT